MEMARENMCHPFVKWAGRKRQLIGEIEKSLPEDFRERDITYIEPFVGGGAVLFHMLQEYPNIRHAVINDINKSLVAAYTVVRDDVEGLIRALGEMKEEYMPLSPEGRSIFILQESGTMSARIKRVVRMLGLPRCSSSSTGHASTGFTGRTGRGSSMCRSGDTAIRGYWMRTISGGVPHC